MKITQSFLVLFIFIGLMLPLSVQTNNISVGTTTLTGVNTTDDYIFIRFDLSWENSWLDDINWDAAWVFVKYQETGGDWTHASLNTTASNHTIPSGYTCSVGLTGSTGMGVFIFRNTIGSGNNNLTGVMLRWEYGDDGLADDATVIVKVFAIEIVYVPQGAFYVGDADSDLDNCFYEGSTTHEFQITGEDAITVSNTAGNLYYDMDNGYAGDQNGPIPADFPKGYDAFYCMKYEISQGQYADFLNTLTATQDGNRSIQDESDYTTYRGTIGGSAGSRSASRPDRACQFLSWADGCAYADWSGLRPITELEFEKSCRGTLPVVDDEYAWGSTIISPAATISGTEDGTETITNSDANCCYNGVNFTGGDGGQGPLRCGIFTQSTTNRQQAGASYYGIMELSGNICERCVTVGNASGRGFTGIHGDGVLDSNGNANVSGWPDTDALGAGFRGGWWYLGTSCLRVSVRDLAGITAASRKTYGGGFRCVRSAP
jgi:formylglycine-generating enzyme required for sulfatase activity